MSLFKSVFAGLALVATLALAPSAPSVSASAASCAKANTRIATSSNTVYITGSSTVCTPADLSSLYPKNMVQIAPRVYELESNLILQNGATLLVAGGSVAGSTTDELRLMSDNNSTTNNIVYIRADYGNVRFDNTKVTSWDDAVQGPDTEYGSTYKRAYIHVRSRYVNGQQLTSRMDVVNSDIGNLGYNGSEAYGIVWRVMDSQFANVDVLGDVTGSHFHNNWYGMYTFGAYGMNIDGNEFDHNIKYGLDPHDDSDALVITNNSSHDNGDHGIICSQRCDHLQIRGNHSFNNVGHGIMLHRSVDYTVVENNLVENNTDSGIALFESNNDTIQNNTIIGNKNGIRLSVGSSYDQFLNNTITGTKGNAIYTYQGTDTPTRSNGINSYNTWRGNTVSQTTSYVLKLGATDHDTFDSNDFRNNTSAKYDLCGATNTTYTNNLVDAGVTLR